MPAGLRAPKGSTLPKPPTDTPDLKPHFEDVQSHYDLSDDFFRIFLDPTQTYSCAYFERDDMTLEEAQLAKIDLSLGKLDLKPGMTLLDVGCGWGATLRRAIERYDVNVVGLTLSRNQQAHVEESFAAMDSPRTKRVLLEGWEQFHENVDRIISIGAFEHFGFDRYDDFFKMAYAALPDNGMMMLHTIVTPSPEEYEERGLALTITRLKFVKFIMERSFPADACHQSRRSKSMRPRPVSKSRAFSGCSRTTRARWITGRPHWRHAGTRRSRFSPRRCTTGT